MKTSALPCTNEEGFASLGDYVTHLRQARGYTLRDVVEHIDAAITHKKLPAHCSLSRGYLCSLEAGKYTQPSLHKLQALAYVYQVPVDILLRKAGYEVEQRSPQETTQHLLRIAVEELTPEELESLFEFIDFLKAKRTKRCQCQQ